MIELRKSDGTYKTWEQLREEIAETVLIEHNYNIFKAAAALQVGRSSIYRWLWKPKKFNLKK